MYMKRNNIDHDIVVVLAWSLVTLSVWVGLEVVKIVLSTKGQTKQVVETQIKELDPKLKVEVLDNLEQRQP
jgi:hypothetical protein